MTAEYPTVPFPEKNWTPKQVRQYIAFLLETKHDVDKRVAEEIATCWALGRGSDLLKSSESDLGLVFHAGKHLLAAEYGRHIGQILYNSLWDDEYERWERSTFGCACKCEQNSPLAAKEARLTLLIQMQCTWAMPCWRLRCRPWFMCLLTVASSSVSYPARELKWAMKKKKKDRVPGANVAFPLPCSASHKCAGYQHGSALYGLVYGTETSIWRGSHYFCTSSPNKPCYISLLCWYQTRYRVSVRRKKTAVSCYLFRYR